MKASYICLFEWILAVMMFYSCQKDQDILDPETPLFTWSYFSMADGLPSDTINFIFEDFYGNIWVATNSKGVCKFNGSSWKIFNVNDGLINNKVMSINQDIEGNMWFSSPWGFSVMNKSGRFNNYEVSKDGEWMYPDKMIIDKRGWIWATDYFNIGFYIFDGFDFFYLDLGGNYTYVTALAEDPTGKIFIAYTGGVFNFYEEINGQQKWIDYNQSKKLYADYTSSIFFDSQGAIWFGHMDADRVTKISGSTVEYINLYNGWSDANVTSILEDNSHKLWFTLKQGGVINYNSIEPKTFGLNSGLTADNVSCSMMDREGNIWFGTRTSGICIYRPAI